ncbi:MAG: PAS domain-containing protein, partial [Anaerolineales bacterium]|nr:PAS domain-containing protein [Anaerolineales bacterium]
MNWQFNPYILPLLIAVVFSALVGLAAASFHLRHRRETPSAAWLAWLMAAVAFWGLAYAIELSRVDLAAQVFWSKVEYLGITTVPVLWFLFALSYVDPEKALRPSRWFASWRKALLFLIPLLVLALAWTNESHFLIWSRLDQVTTESGVKLLSVEHGLAFWGHVAYSYLLMLAGTLVFLWRYISGTRLYRQQTLPILIGAFVPWLGNALYLFDLSPLRYISGGSLDLTPLAFSLTGILASLSLFRYRMLELLPLASQVVLENLQDGVLVLDAASHLVNLNRAALGYIGAKGGQPTTPRERSAWIGQPASQVLAHLPLLVETLQDQQAAQVDLAKVDLVKVNLGEVNGRPVEARLEPVYAADGQLRGRVILLRDVTTQKQVEEQFVQALQLAEKEKESQTQFLVDMSLELRALLQAVVGQGENLKVKLQEQGLPQLFADLESMESASHLAMRMAHDILYYAQLEAGKVLLQPEAFALDGLVKECLDSVRPLAAKNQTTLTSQILAQVNELYADRSKLYRMFGILLENIVRFTRDGQVEVAVNIGPGVTQDERPNTPHLVVRIQDNKLDLSHEQIAQIFEPFAATWRGALVSELGVKGEEHLPGGSGLGLPICLRLCNLMDGSIQVQSQPEKGIVF